jgi:hypothetical protein
MHIHPYLTAGLSTLLYFSLASPATIKSSLIAPPHADSAVREDVIQIISPTVTKPRLILYHQTHRDKNREDGHISLLPLLRSGRLTHLYIGCYHFSEPGLTRLNDFESENTYFSKLWLEMGQFRKKRPDVKFMAMLGGAAGGFFKKLTVKNLQEVSRPESKLLLS